jgi:membrane protease YdiL (CAAX protease family)
MLSEKPWAIDSVGRLFLGIVGTYCLLMLPISLLDRVTFWPKDQREFLQLLASALLSQICAVTWIHFFLRQHAFGWKEAFGWNSADAVSVAAWGILGGAIFLPVAFALQWLCEYLMVLAHSQPQAQAAVQALQNPALSLTDKLLFGGDAVLLAPLAEESLFRGLLYPAVKQLGYPRLALWGTSLLFAALHFNEPTFVPLVAFGLVLAGLYEKFDNLLAPIAAHSLFNAVNLAILMLGDQFGRLLHAT